MTSKFQRAHIEIKAYIPIDEAELTMEELLNSPQISTFFHGLANLKAATKPKKENKRVKQPK